MHSHSAQQNNVWLIRPNFYTIQWFSRLLAVKHPHILGMTAGI